MKLLLTIQDKILIKYGKIDRDYWMTAEEAKAYGMIDEVLERKK
jgi:ATP-dependent protease ClpP protease subunit